MRNLEDLSPGQDVQGTENRCKCRGLNPPLLSSPVPGGGGAPRVGGRGGICVAARRAPGGAAGPADGPVAPGLGGGERRRGRGAARHHLRPAPQGLPSPPLPKPLPRPTAATFQLSNVTGQCAMHRANRDKNAARSGRGCGNTADKTHI